jgi:hypothetical protein
MNDETVSDAQGAESTDALEATTEVTEAPMDEATTEVVEEQPEAPAPPVHEPESEVTPAPPALEAEEQTSDDDEAAKKAALDRKLTRENQALRKRLKEQEEKVRKYEEASLSEQERQERRLKELEEQNRAYEDRLRESSLSASVSAEAARLNIIDPDAAVKLLDSTSLEYDPQTGWTGIEEALEDLVEQRPYLVRAEQKVAAPKEAPANPARRRTRLTREALANMSQSEIDALSKEDIHAALASD